MKVSFWEREQFFSNIHYTIVGSGIVGLSSAIELKRRHPDKNILVLERGALPFGASTKNAGFACFGSPSEVLDDLKSMSEEEVLILIEKRWKGLQNLIGLVGDKNMDFQNNGSFELFTSEDKDLYEECKEQIGYLNQLVSPIFEEKVYEDHIDISAFGFKHIRGVIKNSREGQIDTGKMMHSLLERCRQEGVQILNGVEVQGMEQLNDKVEIRLPEYQFTTNNLIIATNGFAKRLIPELEVNPARAQVLITSEIPDLTIKGTFHMDKGYYYFRNINNRILLGGGRNLDLVGEATDEFNTTELIQEKLEWLLREVILPNQQVEIDMRWAGIMGVGSKKTTIVKRYSDNVFLAVRMGGMGVAIGSLVGKEVAELVSQA